MPKVWETNCLMNGGKNGSSVFLVWHTGNFNPILQYLCSSLTSKCTLSGKHTPNRVSIWTGHYQGVLIACSEKWGGEQTQTPKIPCLLSPILRAREKSFLTTKRYLASHFHPPKRLYSNCRIGETFFPAQSGPLWKETKWLILQFALSELRSQCPAFRKPNHLPH